MIKMLPVGTIPIPSIEVRSGGVEAGLYALFVQGLKNGGFRGPLPNPKSEGAVTSLHRNLAKYMGTPGPKGLT